MAEIQVRAGRAKIQVVETPGAAPRPGWRGLMRTGIIERCTDDRAGEKPTFRVAWIEDGPTVFSQIPCFASLDGIYPWRERFQWP